MSSAGNQQERLGSAEAANWFLAGFIEGEGCLSVSIKEHPTCRSRYYVDPGFFLYQHESGRRILELAEATFASGRIYPKSGSPRVLVYEVSAMVALSESVVPFFERYIVPFSCKGETFIRFRDIVEMKIRKERLRPDGLARIVRLAYEMNPAGKGKAHENARWTKCWRESSEAIRRTPCFRVKRWSSPHGDMRVNCLR